MSGIYIYFAPDLFYWLVRQQDFGYIYIIFIFTYIQAELKKKLAEEQLPEFLTKLEKLVKGDYIMGDEVCNILDWVKLCIFSMIWLDESGISSMIWLDESVYIFHDMIGWICVYLPWYDWMNLCISSMI